MDKILELAKQAGAVSYTNRHYPDRPYRTFGPEELQKFYTLARADYETKLSAVMPADFKDWHENNRSEWPDIAAWVITNLREQRSDLEVENAKWRSVFGHLGTPDECGNEWIALQDENAKLKEALSNAIPYIGQALAEHDNAYGRHPATEPERASIQEDLETARAALGEK